MTGILTQLNAYFPADDAAAKRGRRLSLRAAFALWFGASAVGWGLIGALVWWLW